MRGGLRGGYRGGYAGPGAGRDFSNDLYADYSGPDQAAPGGGMHGYGGGYAAGGYAGAGAPYDAEPSQQIMVRNVSATRIHCFLWSDPGLQLPWSTANEDLVELFETTGQVELAEILFEGTRSKGCGVVQFAQVAEAETAIGTLLPAL